MSYVSFDLYGTLLRYDDLERSWRDWQVTLHAHLTRHGLELAPEDFPAVCRGFFSGNLPAREGHSVFESRLLALAERLGLALEGRHVGEIADDCCHAWQQSTTLDPDCVETLSHLAERHSLFLVSNFDHPRHVRRLLGELGLSDFFQELVISGEHGVKKPEAALFAPLAEKYAIAPRQCLHVGDSIEDYHFALNAHLVPVLLGEEQRINGRIDYLENEPCTVSGVWHAARLVDVIDIASRLEFSPWTDTTGSSA